MTVTHVIGARPNFIKIAPIMQALKQSGIEQKLVHTGQHSAPMMSDVFFTDLDIPKPDFYLGNPSILPAANAGSNPIPRGVPSDTRSSYEAFIGALVHQLLDVIVDTRPYLVLVVGDVTSTLAGALAATALGIPVAHVEAGLRSHDFSMPEEINRLTVDHLSELLFVSEQSGMDNLMREEARGRAHYVGNVMIDTLLANLDRARERRAWERFNVSPGQYILVTIHRPGLVDDPGSLAQLVDLLELLGRVGLPVVFPVHPRTLDKLTHHEPAYNRVVQIDHVRLIEPLGYLDFVSLMDSARLVITDSGGIQEETSVLGIPCLTARNNTERPATIQYGTNRLVGVEAGRIMAGVISELVEPSSRQPRQIELWDGHVAERIAAVVKEYLEAL